MSVLTRALRLKQVVESDAAWDLLRKDRDHAPVAAAILAEHLDGEVRQIDALELYEKVDADLAELRSQGLDLTLTARAYLTDWAKAGYLIRRPVAATRGETFLSLPTMPGVVAAYGQGNAVVALARIPWLHAARIFYWGDLDSHGFRILNQARSVGLEAQSVLMDSRTLYEHRDLWVVEPNPFPGTATLLVESEAATLAELRGLGHVRLEQERIPWAYALEELGRRFDQFARAG